jgi:hypothetical protein
MSNTPPSPYITVSLIQFPFHFNKEMPAGNSIPPKFVYVPACEAIYTTFWSGVPGFVDGVATPAKV